MIYVIATIQVKPGRRDAFLTELRRLLPAVRAEQGCLEYVPTLDARTDIKVQVPFRENVVSILEKWETLPALRAHLAAPHMAEYRERVKDLLDGVTLQVLQPC